MKGHVEKIHRVRSMVEIEPSENWENNTKCKTKRRIDAVVKHLMMRGIEHGLILWSKATTGYGWWVCQVVLEQDNPYVQWRLSKHS